VILFNTFESVSNLAFANGLDIQQKNEKTFLILKQDPKKVTTNLVNDKNIKSKKGKYELKASRDEYGELFIEMTAVEISISQILQDFAELIGIEYIIFDHPDGNVTANLEAVGIERFFDFLLKGTEFTYKKESDHVYMIGKRSEEGLRMTKTIPLQYRPIEQVVASIPTEIQSGVQVVEFPELNSLILSGSSPNIAEVESFISSIDVPVPVIMIELIIIEVNKNHEVNSGIQIGTGDVPANNGSILPGIDWVVDGSSLNTFLNSVGLSNLGRFAPNFYIGLNLLEQNGYLNIRSTPRLSTLNGHKASLSIGQSTFYNQPEQNIFSQQNTQTVITNNFQELSADFSIDIEPFVSGDEHVTMTITVDQQDFVPATLEGAPPGRATRKFESKIRVKNDDLIVLGGLERESLNNSGSGLPLISRIPILRWFFGNRKKSKSKDKLMIFIRPTIIN
jgi:type IV pilus assembly protein PilQ